MFLSYFCYSVESKKDHADCSVHGTPKQLNFNLQCNAIPCKNKFRTALE